MRVLVAYGSTMGGTARLAGMIGSALTEFGFEVDVQRGRDVAAVEGYDAVVIGGALYYYVTWHRDARVFVRNNEAALCQCPVWLFSSGPLDDSASNSDIPPIRPVRKIMERIGARGHATFGGRLENESRGIPVGDWRDPEQVRRWAEQIAGELTSVS
jgi:menaquinone-dependent protoporphyrinogen oxidase